MWRCFFRSENWVWTESWFPNLIYLFAKLQSWIKHDSEIYSPCAIDDCTQMWLMNISLQSLGHEYVDTTASTLLGRLSIRLLNLAAGIQQDRQWGQALMLGDKTCWMLLGSRSGICAGQSSSFTSIWENSSLWTWLCAWGHCHVDTAEGLPQTVSTMLSTKHCFVNSIVL